MVKIIVSAAVIPKYWTWPNLTVHISLGTGKHSEGESHIIQKFTDTVKNNFIFNKCSAASIAILHERPYELCMLQAYSDTKYDSKLICYQK